MEPTPITVPKAAPEPLPALATYLQPCVGIFRRSESRASLERYVTGLLTDLPRKNCDAIAAAVAGTSTERLQHLLTDADWDAEALDRLRVGRLVASSPAGGVLVLDDTGLPKQGKHSVGVARQYSGTLGRTANCQIIVSTEYLAEPSKSRPLHWPVSAQLYLHQSWADDPARCARAHVPADITFQTKPQIALTLIDRARDWAVPFHLVVADAGYGENPALLRGLDERALAYICGVPSSFGARKPDEVAVAAATPPPTYQGRGRPRLPRPAPRYTVATLAAALPDDAWQTIAWREGTKGQLRKRFAALRVHWATGSPVAGQSERSTSDRRVHTGPEGWLLVEQPLPGEEGPTKYYLSNLPADTPLRQLVLLAHSRWVVEQFYEDAKGECGLDEYQGRRWDGLHRHLALVMLAYSFLVWARSQPPEAGGLFPLSRGPLVPRPAPTRARLAVARPHPLARHHQATRSLPTSTQLTK
jgi:SRSO17 transposase